MPFYFSNLILQFAKFKMIRKKKIKKLEELLTKIQLMVDSAEVSLSTQNASGLSGKIGISSDKLKITTGLESIAKEEFNKKHQLIKKEYYNLISELEKEVTKNIKKNEEFYVIYDDLDQIEEFTDLDSFLDLMKTMIYAADNINSRFRKKNIKARIIHVVRSDIKELMLEDSSNIQKVFSDYGIEIDWFSNRLDHPYYHPIIKMLLHKIRKSIPSYSEFDDKRLYNCIFVEDEPILDFLLKNSLGRPREIIQMMSYFQRKFGSSKVISMGALTECLPEYSEWLYNALLSELKIQKNSVEIKKVFSVIQERGSKNFTYLKLKEYIENNSKLEVDDLMATLRMMYNLGIIGIRNKNGTVQFNFRSNLNAQVKEYTKLIIHIGLFKYLNLV